MTFKEFISYFDFTYKEYPDGYGLVDQQVVNIGDIEGERFSCAEDMIQRLVDGIYGEDYLNMEDKTPEPGSYEYYALHPEELTDLPPVIKDIDKIYETAAGRARAALERLVHEGNHSVYYEIPGWCDTPHVLTAICFNSEDEKEAYINGTFEKGKHFPSVFVNVDDYFDYYGVCQMCHGADHVFVFDEVQMRDAVRRGDLPEECVPTPDTFEEESYVPYFPWGGSNVSEGCIICLEGKKGAVEYLSQMTADGPDYDDPPLVAMAEYYWKIETDEGCAKDLLKWAHLDRVTVEKEAQVDHDQRITDIVDTLGNINFYSDEYRNIRLSSVYFIKEIKDTLKQTDLEWDCNEGASYEPEMFIKIPRHAASEILMANNINIYGLDNPDKELIDYVFLHIEKHEDDIAYSFVNSRSGDTLDNLTFEDNDFIKDKLAVIIKDILEEKDLVTEESRDR